MDNFQHHLQELRAIENNQGLMACFLAMAEQIEANRLAIKELREALEKHRHLDGQDNLCSGFLFP